ncbi:MAG: hypothetical protein KBT27_02675 [Prevotellaceae bacterium]|nr:hypothetical protein [Candidatus Faecinaster equi]
MNTQKDNTIFGWKIVFKHYTICDMLQDLWFPILVAGGIVVTSICTQQDSFEMLCKLVHVSLGILPAMLALLLTAYVFFLTFFLGDKMQKAMQNNPDNGPQLLSSLNASFAIGIIVPLSAVIILFITSCIIDMQIEVDACMADVINYVLLFVGILLTTLSVSFQFGVVIDLFNCGQVAQQ